MNDELRVSDLEREQAVSRLREASAEGRLTLDELATRTGSAYVAQTRAELAEVTHDLPAAQAGTAERSQRPRFVVGVFVPVWRRNRWQLGRRTFVVSLFAPTFFDLRSATLEDEDATITVFSVFAPVNVIAPEHVDVQLGVFGIFAPVRELGSPGELAPAAPRIRVNGLSLFAPVFVNFKRS
jgi:hypothetical protein